MLFNHLLRCVAGHERQGAGELRAECGGAGQTSPSEGQVQAEERLRAREVWGVVEREDASARLRSAVLAHFPLYRVV